jgi:ClpP class serine protease
MSTWNQIREEFQNAQHKDIRMKYAKAVSRITKRNLLIYASEFTSGSRPPHLTSLSPDDKIFFGDAIRSLDPQKGIDVLIESPGGIAEVAEAIAKMLWSSFTSVRFIVPSMPKARQHS